ncbi:ATP-binding protein [Rheinheimera pleomorphica]|uniref:ATP-binding protein n=1 Tax=Rheinheimera pleomorphica TaxID=2703963 RepID=UPI00141F8151|nr:ATP-binding protein [Rheinheimera pleomorphica]
MNTVMSAHSDIFLGGHVSKALNIMMNTINHTKEKAYGQLVIGESGVGKTTLCKYLAETLNLDAPVIDEVKIKPALYVKITTLQTPTQLALELLAALDVTIYAIRLSHQRAMQRLKQLLSKHQVKVIIVDEMQNALPYTAGQRLLEISKCVAEILDDTNIPMILVGTPALRRLLELDKRAKDFQTEEQIARRFRAELEIPAIPMGTWAWLEAINYFMTKHGLAHITEVDKVLMYRLHIATKGKPALLAKLFSLAELDKGLKTKEFLHRLKQSYEEGFGKTGNPFDEKLLTDRELEKHLQKAS